MSISSTRVPNEGLLGSRMLHEEYYTLKLFDRFWKRVNKSGDCWVWTGGTDGKDGYGRFSIAKNLHVIASRFAYEMYYGPFDQSLLVCHTCDNVLCVKKEHLFLGTVKDNSRDMANKGRAKGRGHKLTQAQREEAIQMLHDGAKNIEVELTFRLSSSYVSVLRQKAGLKKHLRKVTLVPKCQ